ncbi:cobalamin-binding protein [Noviherbaspirillum denitrificans]|uniref:Cobalamin-binding protein n=1 Tax=Noviherbaspirillum denitrificans TaxID=1968433 RepID=A0A254TCE2_9BURK|nr:cobalamin-binding protein [Noviherbaspirillum denitrificans]OWW19837.1 cobalamin-binding protein [Noviherbaspirillum denitrificans]
MNYRRIVCLSTEAVETLYALGAEDAIAGISGFTTRPARARAEKPKVSGFSSSRIERILNVQPDLVIGFSDMQAGICSELVSAGVEVHLFNQRDIAGIFHMVNVLAALVGKQDAGWSLVDVLQAKIEQVRAQSSQWSARPKVYFEEWNDPPISGIGWVSELIAIAGGDDIFPELAAHSSAKARIIADADEVVRRAPDIIIGSWCGKKFRPETVTGRPGWDAIPAVRDGMVAEVKSADILSPGPGAITEGLPQIAALVRQWQELRA